MYQRIKLVLSARIGVAGLVLLVLTAFLFQSGNVEASLRSTPSEGFSFDFGRWPYPLHAEVNARLQELARHYPKLARTHIIGKTRKGRDLMVMEITNRDTGPGESKPALWMDGNMHMGEETGRIYLAYFIDRLLFEYGKNPDATRLVDTRTFYVLPVFDADSGERMLTRHPAWPGYKPEEHAGRDIDGDGYITRMRVKDDSRRRGYRYYIEAPDVTGPEGNPLVRERRQRNELTGEREDTDFNRNWSAEWEPQEGGAGPYPFSLPEVRAVADFITSHRNIFFAYNIHSGGGAKSYMVRPPMNHPDDFMPLEDNDFYVRIGAIWAALSEGGLMQTNYMSWNFNSRRPDPSDLHGEGTIENDRWRITGFSNDWCYMHAGIHSISPEVEGSAPDYNDDGFIRPDEIDRWHREEKGGQFFSPWKPYNHPVLGEVEIGGSRGIPAALDDTAKMHSEWQYDLLRHIADRSPLLRIKDLTSEPISGGRYRVVATLQNTGFLATYVTQNAIKIRRDYPANARIQVTGGEVVEGEPTQNAGHLPGRLTVISRWSHGEEVPTKTVEWTIKATGSEPLKVSVEAWAPKAGRDQQTLTIEKSSSDTNPFTKQVEVFGIHVYATSASPDDKVLHAANVLAEYLDSDEDGIPDNPKIVEAMLSVDVSLMITKNPEELATVRKNHERFMPRPSKSVWADNIGPQHGVDSFNDEALEEVLHMITRHGYGNVYPEAFSMTSGTKLSQAMDIARGGHYEEVPEEYPEDAWFTYYDETCRYSCQLNEYLYWGITSILGSQDFPGRLERIGDEWPLNTKEKVKAEDAALYALLTDPQYRLPTVLPDGKYRPKTFTIHALAAESRTIDDHDRGLSEHFRIEARPSQKPDFEIIPLDNLNGVLDRKILVFGIPVFAYSGVSDEDLVRTAHVTAQWLDNDEDGTVDHRLILDELAKRNAYVFIVENQEQVNSYNFQNNTEAYSLDAESINRDWYSEEGPSGRADGTMEEPFHMVSDVGYGNLYPDVFATREGTELANAMDIARGGHFERTPDKYPDGAWYTYDAKGCGYGCMAGEYFYWGMISILGVNDNRGDAIKDEWKLYTRELVESKDPRLFDLLTNPEYKFPTKTPDGTYGE